MNPLSFVKMNANNKTEIRFIKLSLSHSRAPHFPFKLRLADIFSWPQCPYKNCIDVIALAPASHQNEKDLKQKKEKGFQRACCHSSHINGSPHNATFLEMPKTEQHTQLHSMYFFKKNPFYQCVIQPSKSVREQCMM